MTFHDAHRSVPERDPPWQTRAYVPDACAVMSLTGASGTHPEEAGGEPVQALRALDTAAGARAEDRHRSGALTRARLAETLLGLGRLEESCVHWHVFLDHYPSLRSATADRALRRLRTSLRGFRHQPHAADVLRRARSLTPRPRQQAP
ncbi:hypothetical protein [Streptomyces sp. NPDC056987]|uniref:hypothetical protein n=1 Tax=Streptomyces sp. NPDC056987 TaxID=3345988 RepID=UPI003640048E